jgi:ubiquinone/menaquinone biosynthesis C-methylase UbiE
MTRRGFWDRYLRVYDALNRDEDYRAYLDEVAVRLGARPGVRILDAGSGTGNLSIRMRGLGADVVSLDFSPVALAIHREKDPSAATVLASLESRLPFPDGAFDSAACTSVLFALSEAGVRSALDEFRRVLRPGGRLVVTVAKKRASVLGHARDYLGSRWGAQGPAGFVKETAASAGPLLRMVYYCLRVRRLRQQGGWRRYSKQQLLGAICSAGFTRLRYGTTFADRFHVVEAENHPVSLPAAPGEQERSDSWPLEVCSSASPATRMRSST